MNKYLLCFLLLALVPRALLAQSAEVRKANFNIRKSIGIEGYDPVSYFNGRPEKGADLLRTEYKGVSYFFYNEANLKRFKSNPTNFEPAYGGWCAYAMGKKGEKVKIDPQTFKIKEGRLYLFYNFFGNNTLTDWNLNEKELKTKADQHWAKLLH